MGVVAVTDPSGGSDVAGMQTSARLEGDRYILNGRKCFITNAHLSDAWVVIAKTGEGRKGYRPSSWRKGFKGAVWAAGDKVGLRGANTGELIFQDCEVPKENLVGE